jgi:hypothetical protein
MLATYCDKLHIHIGKGAFRCVYFFAANSENAIPPDIVGQIVFRFTGCAAGMTTDTTV